MTLATIYSSNKRKIVGEITDTGYFKKTVKKSKHLFRKLDSWGMDYKILIDAVFPQCQGVFIFDTEDRIYYYADMSDFGSINEFGKFIASDKVFIRQYDNFGVQVFLPRRYWKKFGKGDIDERTLR